MRTFYRGPNAFVTADRFVWRLDTPRFFALRELSEIRRVEHIPQDRRSEVVLVAAAGSIGFAAAGWMILGPVIGATAVALTVVAAIFTVSTRRFRDVRSYRLVATVRGVRTVIFETTDFVEFNQVARAVKRTEEVGLVGTRSRALAVAS